MVSVLLSASTRATRAYSPASSPIGFAALRVADYIALCVVLRVLPVGPCQLLPRVENWHAILGTRDLAGLPHRPMDVAVDLPPRFVVRRDNQRPLRRPRILPRHLPDTLSTVLDLMHTALVIQARDRFFYLAPRKLFHRLFQHRIFLPQDLIETRRAQPASCNCAYGLPPRLLHAAAHRPRTAPGRGGSTAPRTSASAVC